MSVCVCVLDSDDTHVSVTVLTLTPHTRLYDITLNSREIWAYRHTNMNADGIKHVRVFAGAFSSFKNVSALIGELHCICTP